MNTYFKNLIENNKKINNVEGKLNSSNNDEKKKINNVEGKLNSSNNDEKKKIINNKINDNNKELKNNDFLKLFEDFIFT